MRQSGRPPFSDSSPRAPQRVRDHLRPPEHRGRPLGVLAQTVMSLRAILARRFAPPAPPAQRDYALSRRATPSWMADALVRPTPSEPGPVPAAPPEPWSQSPYAPPAHPASRPARVAAPSFGPQAEAFSPEAFSPDTWAPTPAPVPAEPPRTVAPRPAQAREQAAHGQGPEAFREVPARSPLPVRAADTFVPPVAPAPVEPFPSDEPEGLAPPAVMVAPEPAAPRRASTWAPDPALVPDGGWAMPIPPAGPARAVLTRARRRDAEPSASPEPEARVRPAPERSPEAGVRFTRTPDHVLQARQRRREQALREKEEAQRAAEAEAAARAAAELAAAEAAQAEAEAARIEAEAAAAAAAVPIWRQPFVLPPGVRFTRTPDHLLRHSVEEPAPVETVPPHDTAGETAPDAALPVEPVVDGPVATEALPADPIATEALSADPITIEAAGAFPETSPLAEAPGVAPEAVVEAVQVDSVQVQAFATEPARFECVSVGPTAVEAAAIRPLVFGPACVFGPAAPEPAAPAPVSVEAAATFDEPDAAILVPVDVSHLRSLPPRPVYALDRLLQHDWTHPLSTSLEQDNRPLEEPAAGEPVAVDEAPAAADLPVEGRASVAVVPEASPVADTAPEVVAPAMLDAVDQSIAAEPVFLPVQDFSVQDAEAVATVEDALADLPPATILLPAPAPMLALTYAPLADAILLPAPSAPEAPVPALPLLFVEADTAPAVADEAARLDAAPVPADIAVTEAASVEVALADPAPVAPISSTTTAFASTSFSSTSFAFAPVPWSFIAADAQPLVSMTLPEPLPSAPAPAEPAPAAAPQAGQPFVYVPTGRLNAQPPAPTLPSPRARRGSSCRSRRSRGRLPRHRERLPRRRDRSSCRRRRSLRIPSRRGRKPCRTRCRPPRNPSPPDLTSSPPHGRPRSRSPSRTAS